MTHEERLALIGRPIVLLNRRVVHSVKRWAGVFVNDNFGEGLEGMLRRAETDKDVQFIIRSRVSPFFRGESGGRYTLYDAGMYAGIETAREVVREPDSPTQFGITVDEYLDWERAVDNDEGV